MKIARKLMKIFGINAGANQRSVFGSLAAGSPAYSTDPDTIQSLSEYEEGWYSGVLGTNNPPKQDRNSLDFLFAYQLAYLLQHGIPEYNADTEYYIGSYCQVGGVIYKSVSDANIGNPVTDNSFWTPYYDENQLKILASIITRNFTTISGGPNITNKFVSVAWSPTLKMFVAVAQTGTGDRVAYSYTGRGWDLGSSAADNNWSKVIWAEELGLFIAVSLTGSTTQKCMTSPDGLTWTLQSMQTTDSWQDMAYSPELQRVVALGVSTPNDANYSDDGTTWVGTGVFTSGNPRAITWSKKLGLFLAVQLDPNSPVATSPDGDIWTTHASTHSGFNAQGLCWSEELGIFCGVKNTGVTKISSDGITWSETATSGFSSAGIKVKWNPDLRIFISFGSFHVPHYSYDGVNWQYLNFSEDMLGCEWSKELNIFAGVGDDRHFYSL